MSSVVLPSTGRTEIYRPALPALVRIATAFPPLVEDVAGFFIQLGRVCLSQSCLHESYDHRIVSSLFEQLDNRNEEDDDEETNFETTKKPVREEKVPSPASDVVEQMDVDVKKEKEEGELEEGELPEARPNNPGSREATPALQQTDALMKNLDLCSDLSINFSPTQIQKLFKLLPESSVMGAEIARTYVQLCDKAILHKKIY